MNLPSDQIDELDRIYPSAKAIEEGGKSYIYISDQELPEGCTPCKVDLLFCPCSQDGYTSRLYFSEKIQTAVSRNWNGRIRILDQNWYAISWRVKTGLRLVQTLRAHLDALKNGK